MLVENDPLDVILLALLLQTDFISMGFIFIPSASSCSIVFREAALHLEKKLRFRTLDR